jgi:hypothetical protein
MNSRDKDLSRGTLVAGPGLEAMSHSRWDRYQPLQSAREQPSIQPPPTAASRQPVMTVDRPEHCSFGDAGSDPLFKRHYPRSIKFLTVVGNHFPPRAVCTPRAFRTSAISRKVFAPAFWAAWTIGSTFLSFRVPGVHAQWPLNFKAGV